MAYINIDTEADIYPDDFFHACNEGEKEELRDLVMEHFKIPHLDKEKELADAVVDHVSEHADTMEAKEYVRRVISDMQERLKMRDFS